MTITSKIKDSVRESLGIPCYYQSEEELNRIFDGGEFPCAFFTLLRSQGITQDNGNIRERVQIAMFFADVAEFDYNAERNERIIDLQKQRAYKWLLSLRRSDTLRLVSTDGSERAYAEYDVILTGYAVRVTLEELQGVTICDV